MSMARPIGHSTSKRWYGASLCPLFNDDDETLGTKVFGVPRSERANLRRLGVRQSAGTIHDRTFQRLMTSITPQAIGQTEKFDWTVEDDGSSHVTEETVRWSIFDLFENDLGANELHPFVIHAASLFAQVSSTLFFCICIWSCWYSTLLIAYWDVLEDDWTWGRDTWRFRFGFGIDIFCDILFFLLALARQRTTVLDALTCMETIRPYTLALLELRSKGFWIDILSCLPWTILAIATDAPNWLMLFKTLRVRHLARQERVNVVFASDWSIIIRLLLFVMLGGHLLSCLFFVIIWHTNAYLRHQYFKLTESPYFFLEFYAFSLRGSTYLVLGADMEGYSDIENATIFCCTLLGVMVNSLVFSQIIVVLSRRSTLETQEVEEANNTRQAMQTLGLPSALQLRIFAHYTYERVHRGQGTVDKLLGGLSQQLNFELHLARHYRLVTAVPFFKCSHPYVLREIVLVLTDVIFLPGDFICRLGDEGKEMYFLHKGVCSVIGEGMMACLRKVHEGDYFGEISLLTGMQRTAYVRADSFCMVAELSKEKFDLIMRRFPQQLQVIVSGFSEEQKTLLLQIRQRMSLHEVSADPSRRGSALPSARQSLFSSSRTSIATVTSTRASLPMNRLPQSDGEGSESTNALAMDTTALNTTDLTYNPPKNSSEENSDEMKTRELKPAAVHASGGILRHGIEHPRRPSTSSRASGVRHRNSTSSTNSNSNPMVKRHSGASAASRKKSVNSIEAKDASASKRNSADDVTRNSTSSLRSSRGATPRKGKAGGRFGNFFKADNGKNADENAGSVSSTIVSLFGRGSADLATNDGNANVGTQSSGFRFFGKNDSAPQHISHHSTDGTTSGHAGGVCAHRKSARSSSATSEDVLVSRNSADFQFCASSKSALSVKSKDTRFSEIASSSKTSKVGLRLRNAVQRATGAFRPGAKANQIAQKPDAPASPPSQGAAIVPLEPDSPDLATPTKDHVCFSEEQNATSDEVNFSEEPSSSSKAAAGFKRRPSMLGNVVGAMQQAMANRGAKDGASTGPERRPSLWAPFQRRPSVAASLGGVQASASGDWKPADRGINDDDEDSSDSDDDDDAPSASKQASTMPSKASEALDRVKASATEVSEQIDQLAETTLQADTLTTDVQGEHQQVYQHCQRMEDIWLRKRAAIREERRGMEGALAVLNSQIAETHDMLMRMLSEYSDDDLALQAINIVESGMPAMAGIGRA